MTIRLKTWLILGIGIPSLVAVLAAVFGSALAALPLRGLLITSLLFGLALMLLLERLIFRRWTRLSRELHKILSARDFSARLSAIGHDDLSALADAINKLIEALEKAGAEMRRHSALRESEERYRRLVELSPEAVIIHSGGRCVFANPAALKLIGASRSDQIMGKELLEFFHEDSHKIALEANRLAASGQDVSRIEQKLLRLDGRVLDVEVSSSAFTFRGKPAIQSVMRDITERKQAAERLNYLAYHDVLTGLPNRLCFNERLSQALGGAAPESLAILLLDLDRFKEVNDSLGHAIGDRLLQVVAERLVGSVRSCDMVARVSGDEFFIVLPGVTGREAAELAARSILQTFEHPFRVDDHEFHISASMGVTLCPLDGISVEVLGRNADMAMYRAKAAGRNNYQFFLPEMSAAIVERRNLENALRKGIENNELVVFYQPQVELAGGMTVGAEALVRWQHPTMGMVSPAQFIPLAEDTGLILPIGERVLRMACTQARAWQDAGRPPISISVNISARQFQQGDLVATIRDALRTSGLDPRFLDLEITESTLMQEPDLAIKVMSELKEMGVRISIDDFGTGHSSLNYLKRFPADTIKIDRSFIRDITSDADASAIAGGIIALVHSLKLRVVAEGVETPEQWEHLRQLGCDQVQGFLIGKPVPASEFWDHLRADPLYKAA